MRKLLARQTGFTYLAVLFLVAVIGIALASVGLLWTTVSQREKERNLLFVGDQFRKAIAQYYERTPGTLKRYPASLNDLLKDERYLSVQRHLRKIYLDPMTRSREWGIVPAPEGGIMGVYSKSAEKPLKIGGFTDGNKDFEGKQHYSEWKFVHRIASPTTSITASKVELSANRQAQ